jgi:hypothetical protein
MLRVSSRWPLRFRHVLLLVIATLCSPPAFGAAPAASPEAAQRVLDRYVAALGGRAAVDAQRNSHAIGRLSAFGLNGVTESWVERPMRTASSTHLGPFTLLTGFDGTTGWRTDPSGKLMVLEGRDLDRAKSSAWFENERFLDADHGGGTITYVGPERDSLGSYETLEIAAPGDKPRRYAFDTKTGLPVREIMKEDQQTLISTLSDWRKVAGRLTAFHTRTEVVGMSANALTLDIDSIEVNVTMDASHFAVPEAAAGAIQWLKQDGRARLPFRYIGRHVWLRASINGAPPADFLFDTGASITVIDSAYAAKLGLATEGKMDAMGAGSSGGASFAKLKSLRVAGDDGDGVELGEQKVGVLSVNSILAPFFWRDCAGVLGYSFISQFVTEIDFDAGVLVLRDPKKFAYAGKGQKLAMSLAGTVPVVKMKLNRTIEGDFRLDVGSNSTVDVHGPFAKKNGLDRLGGRQLTASGAGFGGEFTSTLTRIKRIDIGPYGWDDPLVSLSGATTGALASEDYAGNVGNEILERFKCTLDYDHHAVYLEPGAKYARRDPFSRTGLLLMKIGDTVTTGQVLKGSPADKAGIKEGDTVLSIDGKSILEYQMNDIIEMFENGAVGRKMVIEVKRDDQPKKITIQLKDMI